MRCNSCAPRSSSSVQSVTVTVGTSSIPLGGINGCNTPLPGPEADFLRDALPDSVRDWARAYRTPAKVQVAALDGLIGRYRRSVEGGRTVEIRAADGVLTWHDPTDGGRMPLVPSSPSAFHSIDARIDFDLSEAATGAASGMRMLWSNGTVMEFTRVPADESPSETRTPE